MGNTLQFVIARTISWYRSTLKYESYYFARPIPLAQVGQSKLRRASSMNSVSPSITMVLHSFSEIIEFRFSIANDASSLDMLFLHPVMARRFFPLSVVGLLLKTAPPEKSPLFIRSKFAAFSLYNLARPVSGKPNQAAARVIASPVRRVSRKRFRLDRSWLCTVLSLVWMPPVVQVVWGIVWESMVREENSLSPS